MQKDGRTARGKSSERKSGDPECWFFVHSFVIITPARSRRFRFRDKRAFSDYEPQMNQLKTAGVPLALKAAGLNDRCRLAGIKVRWPLAGVFLLFASLCVASDLQSLLQTERDFAAASIKMGMREAFLAFLADDSVLFRPDEVPGKEWMENHPPRGGILTWEPSLAEAASDLGYTSGPWEFREKSLQDKPVAYGYFVTLWKKQSDGKWKVVLDTGTTNPTPTAPATLSLPPTNAAKTPGEEPLKVDTALCNKSKNAADLLADSVIVFRDDAVPVIGKEAAAAAMNQSCTPEKGFSSSDGLLGYTYGKYEKGSYVRIWKNIAGSWKLLIDVSTPD
jgi:ketosteroid isomerase-like protein